MQACLCPLTLEVMEDPVMAMDGFTYERSGIEAYFAHQKRSNALTRSPCSRQVLESERLLPNRALKAVIEARRRMTTNVSLPTPLAVSRQNSARRNSEAEATLLPADSPVILGAAIGAPAAADPAEEGEILSPSRVPSVTELAAGTPLPGAPPAPAPAALLLPRRAISNDDRLRSARNRPTPPSEWEDL